MKKAKDKKIRILLADDHLVVRMGLAAVLSLEADMEVVGEADSGVAAVELASALKPDVIIMDLMMPRLTGDQAAEAILAKLPDTRILILTSFVNANELKRAFDVGVAGGLPKTASQQEIIAAIRAVMEGQPITDGLVPINTPDGDAQKLLSDRQIEILRLVSHGFTNQEISTMLAITHETVKSHLRNIFVKLDAASRTEAATLAASRGLI